MTKLLFLKKIKNKLRTSEAQIVLKLKNNETRPKLTGSFTVKSVLMKTHVLLVTCQVLQCGILHTVCGLIANVYKPNKTQTQTCILIVKDIQL